ncbi:hypothetical protein [Microbacterium sp. LWS13-1.2]|uniref:Uncharacterized protein n=1 Tax=Microbacterium sp. LWS13-1.2 TaxID=3135264 RepID=A0AAU6SDY7_9MICO
MKVVQDSGSVEFRGIQASIGRALGGQRVCVMDAGKTVIFFDLRGTIIIEHPLAQTRSHPRQQPPTPRPRPQPTMRDVMHRLSEMS